VYGDSVPNYCTETRYAYSIKGHVCIGLLYNPFRWRRNREFAEIRVSPWCTQALKLGINKGGGRRGATKIGIDSANISFGATIFRPVKFIQLCFWYKFGCIVYTCISEPIIERSFITVCDWDQYERSHNFMPFVFRYCIKLTLVLYIWLTFFYKFLPRLQNRGVHHLFKLWGGTAMPTGPIYQSRNASTITD